MHVVPIKRARFEEFTDDERSILHFALQQVAARIMDKAAADEYAKDELVPAAGTFHLASTLASEVGVTVGFTPPEPASLQLAAYGIAEGIAPQAAVQAAPRDDRIDDMSWPTHTTDAA